jgi:hypothetical protein
MDLLEPWRSRAGRFEVPYELLQKHPDVVRRVLSEVIVVRAEMMVVIQAIEYDAYGLAFDQLEEGAIVPRYDIEYDTTADQVSWVRKDG